MVRTHSYRPIRYFALTFLVTYALWFAGAYASHQPETQDTAILFVIVGMMVPFMISLAIVLSRGQSELRRDFFNRLCNLRLVRVRTLPALLLIMPLTVLASIAISVAFGGSVEQFQFAEGFSFSSGCVPVLLTLLLAATFEELGWRGYAFDSLQSKFSLFKATIVFSVLWSLWHFPLVFVFDSYQYVVTQESIWYGLNFFVSIIPMGVIITWFCIKNGKSIPAAILFHFLINMCQELLSMTQMTKCIETGVLLVIAVALVVLDRRMFFSTGHLMEDAGQRPSQSTVNLEKTGIVAPAN